MSNCPTPALIPSSQLPYAFGKPSACGSFRTSPEDFQVEEILGFRPDGEGEHLLLRIEKRNTNTDWLAGELARFAGVPRREVSYAGLKDRHAVTRQWFSIRFPVTKEPDWDRFPSEGISLLEWGRHRRKLRRGALKGNRFQIRIRELRGDREEMEQRLSSIAQQGIPNYFGEQRFGHQEDNLRMADRLFAGELERLGRAKRGIYLSAARSYLFNQVLADRVEQRDWNRALPGDRMILDGSHATFVITEVDAEIRRRMEALEIHPTGPLYGREDPGLTHAAQEREERILEAFPAWKAGLERFGLEAERRALRARVADLQWSWPEPDCLELSFQLGRGSYATGVLRELACASR
jgi:tRNA pseudouridine13 synthase